MLAVFMNNPFSSTVESDPSDATALSDVASLSGIVTESNSGKNEKEFRVMNDKTKKNTSEIAELKKRLDLELKRAEKLRDYTGYFLIVLLTSFVVMQYQIWTDYSHNFFEERKELSELLKDYQTKEEASSVMKEFKDCLWYEGTKFCTRPR